MIVYKLRFFESFSNDDSDGNGNVISKYIYILWHFRDCPHLCNLENAGELNYFERR